MDTTDYIAKATVLVVDDMPDNLALMCALLKDDYRVKVANSGDKALEIAAGHLPDLILLDIIMPGMDGYEVCQKLKANPKTRDIPVIFLTAKVEMEDEQKGLAMGAVDYITKPISPPIVMARVKTHLVLKAASDLLRDKSDQLEFEISKIDFQRDKNEYIELEVAKRMASLVDILHNKNDHTELAVIKRMAVLMDVPQRPLKEAIFTEAIPFINKSTVLVVDDMPDNFSLMSDLLKDDYRVKVANNGEKALEIAADHPPDLILLDIMMPGMDGYEVCEKLKADPMTRDIPVIFLTVMAGVEDEQKGFELGAVDYITKPISPPILLARIKNHLALKAASDFLRDQNDYLELEVAKRMTVLRDAVTTTT